MGVTIPKDVRISGGPIFSLEDLVFYNSAKCIKGDALFLEESPLLRK